MGKKRIRYSSGLAEDWIIPSLTEAEGPATVQTSAETPPTQASGEELLNRPMLLNNVLRSRQVQSEAEDARKRSRYKKALPSGWVASEPEDSSVAALSSTAMDIEGRDESFGSRPGHQSAKLSTRPAHNIHTSLSPPDDHESTPPPAPTEAKEMVIPPRRPAHETRRPPITHNDSFVNRQPRSGQRSYDSSRPSQSLYDTVSPPISLGQSSSAVTDSPSYGRDLPATAPSISSNYSNY